MVGPGEPIDTGEWCVIATNVLGGCRGTTGPSSPADDGKPWGSRFPEISIRDQIAAEKKLVDLLGIDQLASVVGGSMGGMRTLEWAVTYPDGIRLRAGSRNRFTGHCRSDRHPDDADRCHRLRSGLAGR